MNLTNTNSLRQAGRSRSITTKARKSRRRRRLAAEKLESRRLLAGDFHNSDFPLDVNNDHAVQAIDALIVINQMSRQGIGSISRARTAGDAFFDVNNDNRVTPIDALLIINALSRDRLPPTIDVQLTRDTGISDNDSISTDPQIRGIVSDDTGIVSFDVRVDDLPPVKIDLDD
ncbi:MAG: dockerin type I domain-containing protein, partial [Planctomycetota bacterium]